MMDVLQPRVVGDFANRILYGSYEATAETLLPTATLHQLPNSALVIWGSFHDEDGVTYAVCRELPGYSTNGCWVMSDAGRDGLRMVAECGSLWRGSMAVSHTGNAALFQSADVYQGKPPAFRLSFDNGAVEYEELGMVALTARRDDSSGYQFYDPTGAQGSTNHIFLASGTIAGKRVNGWLGLNAHFQSPGINYRISPMIKSKLMLTWFDVANIYEDGSWEQGPIVVGRGGYNFLMISNDKGQVTHGSDLIADFVQREDGYPTQMTIRYFDSLTGEPMTWIWNMKPGTEMFDLPRAAPYLANKRSSEGCCLRAGEKRTVKHSSSWPEFQADDRVAAYRSEVDKLRRAERFR
jgi:hypothetical protein